MLPSSRHEYVLSATKRLLLSLTLLVCINGCAPIGSVKVSVIPKDQSLDERVVVKDSWTVSDRIAIIDLSGLLMNAHEMGLLSEGEQVVSFFVEKLQKAADDKRVKAVVLRINSPGGSVTASDTLYSEVLKFKKNTGKPVVAFFQDVAASGAYYTACAADEIVAQRTTVTGSIGVIMQMLDLTGSMQKLGIEGDAIKSGKFKDSGSPLRKMREEERQLFQDLVNGFFQQFVDVVAAGRPKLSREEILNLADGRVYLAKDALENGLVDRIGTLDDAIQVAKDRAKIKRCNIVLYHRPMDWRPNVYAQTPTPMPSVLNLININMPFDWTKRPRFMYIWDTE